MPRRHTVTGGRAWRLVKQHYDVVRRVSGRGMLIDRLVHESDVPLRLRIAAVAREIRKKKKEES